MAMALKRLTRFARWVMAAAEDPGYRPRGAGRPPKAAGPGG
jgi:hypothetical protein